jgi:hypothetical protein
MAGVISTAAVSHLDRQFFAAANTASYDGVFTTTWTLPYSVATNGTQGHLTIAIYNDPIIGNMWYEDPGQIALSPFATIGAVTFTVIRNSPTTISVVAGGPFVSGLASLVGYSVIIGVVYPSSFELSTLYQRNEKGGAEQRGRLRMGYMEFSYSPMTNVTLTITPQGRSPYTYTFYDPTAQAGAAETMPFRVPVQGRNEDLSIVFSDSTPGSFNFSLIDWEATLTMRSRGL